MTHGPLELADLRRLWEQVDPPADDLVDRMIAAVSTADLDEEFQLLTLVERTHEFAGARTTHVEQTVTKLEFRRGEIILMLIVRPRPDGMLRVDGWIVPDGVSVSLNPVLGGPEVTVPVESGRFVFDGVGPGLVRLWLSQEPATGEASTNPLTTQFVTPAFEI